MNIPEQIPTITIESLVEEISQRKARHPKAREILVVGPAEPARGVFDRIAAGVVVERRTFANGSWRIDTNEGVTVRHSSSRLDGLRGRTADLVVILNDDRTDDAVFGEAALVVLVRRGRVVVL